MFLTPAELAELTGREKPSAQIRELERKGIAHIVNAAGRPVVLKSLAHDGESLARMREAERQRAAGPSQEDLKRREVEIAELWASCPWLAEPWEGTCLSPIKWLAENIAQYLLTKEQILAKSVPANSDGINGQGFYFLIDRDEIVYVGISNDVSFRMARHRQNPNIAFSRVLVVNAPEIVARQMEGFYYELLSPRYNVRREMADECIRRHLKK